MEKAGQGSGVVKWFDLGKGYGFITPQGGDKDVFVHARVLKRAGLTDLTSGQAVSFELEIDRSRNRLSVSKIVRVSSPGASNRPAGT
ncbi:MAG: cold shock domain-containing protein [Proteobacteria bacterium]|nr:cold shock domain-containing protein [Pseudomonadota bacterium]